jgi:hypothetical protein
MDLSPDSQESVAMVEIECPWCEARAELIDGDPHAGLADAVDCAECGVRVEIAADPVVATVARAA